MNCSPLLSPTLGNKCHATWLLTAVCILALTSLITYMPNARAIVAVNNIYEQVLYDLLGRLKYGDDGKFSPVADAVEVNTLQELIAKYQLGRPDASAYILNLDNKILAWSTAEHPEQYNLPNVDAGNYDIQKLKVGDVHLLVQNFWIKQTNGTHVNFRMVLVLRDR